MSGQQLLTLPEWEMEDVANPMQVIRVEDPVNYFWRPFYHIKR
jgi:hypothetical protein